MKPASNSACWSMELKLIASSTRESRITQYSSNQPSNYKTLNAKLKDVSESKETACTFTLPRLLEV